MMPAMPPFPTPPTLPPPPPSGPPPLPQMMSNCSGENQQSAVAYTNVNVYGGGAAGGYNSWPYAQSALPAFYPTRAAISAQTGRTTLRPQPAPSSVVTQTSVTRKRGVCSRRCHRQRLRIVSSKVSEAQRSWWSQDLRGARDCLFSWPISFWRAMSALKGANT
ncbi:hypothetical protein MRX96_048926 [Rhipicephalus microplus]